MHSGLVTPQQEVRNFTYATFEGKMIEKPETLPELLDSARSCGARVAALLGIWVEHCGIIMFVLYDIQSKEYIFVAKDKW